ncbi:flagellar biosynthetic protein FliO [Vibrio sp. V27_P1S3P104]|uniref:flagellar biosynthetic protein FliO n=1 Tax=unclassified Vibrio TaxID=2614977 RepID=UPI00137261C1|nr:MULTISPECIES: flagellar biosynthetic protein FliO [unclassified Vibrio]NAW68824.1 flagellar biosynthetic protein FliO [Vibrio sp. V28_P6S34P95]NAX06466.1 flagellar biosynthetic protein FliO [Vibrio sp. V30_P3S12P165]NAX34406.1 flagellar biosynthetic protein FliO [Vibrio sp. V29_P1S30P107]NAX37826.1 flagellar biosynthetic protein FliO [Vibrio sp. V27_P1S3P104]NAX40504.1 flagellar biosynthetic protein FliO [Vibrio sp. V26_P1S5P106]
MKWFISLWFVSLPVLATEKASLDLATTFGSLLFVVVLILCLAWLLKRMRVTTLGQQKEFQVIRQLPIGTRERLMIVQAGDEQFLIGVTTQSIQLISKLSTPLIQEATDQRSFATQLTQLVKKHDK